MPSPVKTSRRKNQQRLNGTTKNDSVAQSPDHKKSPQPHKIRDVDSQISATQDVAFGNRKTQTAA